MYFIPTLLGEVLSSPMLPVASEVKSGFLRGCFSLGSELPCRGASSISISSAADTGSDFSLGTLVKRCEMVQTNTNSNPVSCPFFAVLKSADFPVCFSFSICQYVRANRVQREGSSGFHHFVSVIVARGSVLEFLDC